MFPQSTISDEINEEDSIKVPEGPGLLTLPY